LFNRLIGDDRSIVHDEPGTTRDAIDTVAELNGRTYRFIDTAGMRKRAREAEGPEYYGLVRSLQAIDSADAVLHVIDATQGATDQDQRIAKRTMEAGCAAVIVLNKWDLIEAEEVERVAADLRDQLRFVPWAPLVRTSALTKRGVAKLLPALEKAHIEWNKRIPTAMLNAWLREAVERVPLGSTSRARPTRIRYVTQSRTRPPQFIFFASGNVTASGLRALENRLRARFGFEGTPMRLTVRGPNRKPRAG
jgi:GTP-binding protein